MPGTSNILGRQAVAMGERYARDQRAKRPSQKGRWVPWPDGRGFTLFADESYMQLDIELTSKEGRWNVKLLCWSGTERSFFDGNQHQRLGDVFGSPSLAKRRARERVKAYANNMLDLAFEITKGFGVGST